MRTVFAAAMFEQVRTLERHFDVLLAEHLAVPREAYAPWPLRGAYEGVWLVFPFFLASYPPDLACDFAANRRRCPETVGLLRGLPRIQSAGYSWLDPGCHVRVHRDFCTPGVVRAHIGLCTPAGAVLDIEGETVTWQAGEGFAFDGRRVHEAHNRADAPRTVLLFDFELTDAEREVVWPSR